VWRPRYLALPRGLALPTVLLDVSSLVSGGLEGVLKR
jgi:phosphatidylglycerol lysyltransferase